MTPYASAMRLTAQEKAELTYLAQRDYLWGGHLRRGEPLNDPHMIRWRNLGLIEAVESLGYRITDAGRRAITQSRNDL